MVRYVVRLSLSILLILLSLPFLAISFLVASLCAAAVAALPRIHQQAGDAGSGTLRPVDQFGFEDALAAYEELIGAHAWK